MRLDPAHNASCQVMMDSAANKKKSKYTCKVDRCNRSCWICSVHKTDNKPVLDEIKTQQMTRGITSGFHVRLSVGAVKKKTKKSFSSTDSLKLTPQNPRVTAQSRCNSPGDQVQVEELFRTVEDQGVDMVAEPKGRPIFMFFPVAGINKPVLTFFDTGCSNAVLREGIPGVECKGCITQRAN